MKFFATAPEDIDQAFIDYYTAIHWASGTVAKSVFGLSQKQCIILAVLRPLTIQFCNSSTTIQIYYRRFISPSIIQY